jgi:Transcriptional regulator
MASGDDLGTRPARGKGRAKAKELPRELSPSERLIQVALPLFAKYGYDAVSTGQIARAAKLSQPMVHYHFQSKERIWKASMDSMMQNLSRSFPNRRDELKDLEPVARLKVLTRRFIVMSAADPTLSRVILHESLAQSERLNWLVRRYVARAFRDFDEAIHHGVELGVMKRLPEFAVANTIVTASAFTFCLGALVKLIYQADLTDEKTIDAMADTIVEILFNGLVKS